MNKINNKQLKNRYKHNKNKLFKQMKLNLKNIKNLIFIVVLKKIQMLKIRNYNYQEMDQCGKYF